MPRKAKNRGLFVSANGKAKSEAVAVLVRAARRARLNYDGFLYVCQQARRKLKLTRPQREQKLPHLLPDAALKRFFQVIQECGDVQHEILLKLLFYTAVRVRELVRIQIDDVESRALPHLHSARQRAKGPLHSVSRQLPARLAKPHEDASREPIFIREHAPRSLHHPPHSTNCSVLSRSGRSDANRSIRICSAIRC
jgi:integrase